MRRARVLVLLAALLGATACSREPSAAEREQWAAETARLEAEADALFARLLRLAAADPGVARLPAGEIAIAVPTAFLERLVQRVFSDVASRVELSLSGIQVHKTKTLRKGVTLGDLVIDLDVERVRGRLAPGTPRVTFGANRLALALPIQVTQGSGDATVHVVWQGRRVSRAVCDDLDLVERVSGSVVPVRALLSGTLVLEASGAEIVGRPRFPETKVNLRIRPSQASWQKIDAVLESRRGLCGWVLDRVDVKKIVAERVEQKGFDVKLPLHKIRPFRFPAGLSESVEVAGRPLALDVRTSTLRIDPQAVWVGAHVRVKGPEAAPPAARPMLPADEEEAR